ncbi:hypothetical protein GIB67_014050 [Kingdonia uniflora]|uniref:Uncharacterized protein n=1 Tax=Kingdonia uniflora TaxID=39325 RepID=A0A7J7KXA1_9MAGN|nr:hypothetical protein GIB67_014050 [Kingdonia uniflora]
MYHGLDTAVTTEGAITGFVQLLPYCFYEYCGVGHPIVKEEIMYLAYLRLRALERGNKRKTNDQTTNLFIIGRYHIDHRTVKMITWEPLFDSAVSETEDVTGEVRIPLDPPLSMSPHISPVALHEMRQAEFIDYFQRMGNLYLFGPSALRAGITLVVVTSASVHSLSQDFSLPSEAKGPDLEWHIEWTERGERLPIARLRDPPPISSSYNAEELWHLTHGLSLSPSDDDLIFNCAAAICVQHQVAVNIVVEDATSSYGGSVMGRKDKRKKRDHPLGYYSIIRDYLQSNCTYEPWEFR